jgi:hypothetical protein
MQKSVCFSMRAHALALRGIEPRVTGSGFIAHEISRFRRVRAAVRKNVDELVR